MTAGEAASDGVYRCWYTLRSCDVDFRQALRPSRLAEMVQEAAIAHTEQLGCGRERTLDRGILWVVASRKMRVSRWPRYGERIVVESWPGAMRHVLFPRFERVLDERGGVLAQAASHWMLVDARTRRMVFPAACGVSIDGVSRQGIKEEPQIKPIAARPTQHERQVVASYGPCDMNGHVNNARYVDVVEDALTGPAAGREIADLACEYKMEVPLGGTFTLAWAEDALGAFAEGGVGGKTAFRMALRYRA